jgi:hypothetical protein
MAYEMSINKSAADEAIPASVIIERCRPHLSNLMGIGGFRALLSRALTLAKEEVSWLSEVQVNAVGTLEGLEIPVPTLGRLEFLEGNEIIIAQLLGLLTAFIGTSLTLQQIREIWPGFSRTVSVAANGEA